MATVKHLTTPLFANADEFVKALRRLGCAPASNQDAPTSLNQAIAKNTQEEPKTTGPADQGEDTTETGTS